MTTLSGASPSAPLPELLYRKLQTEAETLDLSSIVRVDSFCKLTRAWIDIRTSINDPEYGGNLPYYYGAIAPTEYGDIDEPVITPVEDTGPTFAYWFSVGPTNPTDPPVYPDPEDPGPEPCCPDCE